MKNYLAALAILTFFSFNEEWCMENKNEAEKILKLHKVSGSYQAIYNDEYEKDPNYEYGVGKFLYDLFLVIEDVGTYIFYEFNNHLTESFGGNNYYVDIIGKNRVLIWDPRSEWKHEMDLDEFLKANSLYYISEQANADEIIFTRNGEDIKVEPIWYNDRNDYIKSKVKP